MPGQPTDADIGKWHRWFAIEANNRAWRLSEAETRSEAEDSEMLSAAHAAAFHWSKVGTPVHIARAQMLLGHVHALRGHAKPAVDYACDAFEFVRLHDSAPWEVAFSHAVMANAGWAASDSLMHVDHYGKAKELGAALADEEERAIFDSTFRRIPPPLG